jgi:hypothetical protein
MKKSTWRNVIHNLAPTTDNRIWLTLDKMMDFTRTKNFFYISVGMLILGTILGVIAPYLN